MTAAAMMASRRATAVVMAIGFVAAVAMTLASPLRHISGDTVPGRIGAAVLRCTGSFDLARADWIAAGRLPYWARPTGERIVSVFGPGPAVVGALALPSLADGDALDDAMLRRRERFAAGALLGLATALLVLAAAARRGPAASLAAGLVAAASFAGAATLGQGLWQQTVALPALMAAVAALAWRHRAPRAGVLAPALLVLAVLLRPTIAPLALGLGVAWCLERSSPRQWALAIALAVLVAAPLLAWNAAWLGGIVPTQQLEANARVTDHIFVLTRAQVGYGLGGLLVSPARGWLWFAPIAVVGTLRALRDGSRTTRAAAGGICAQLVVVAVFHMWWGGICFGPRFLAEATWLGTWLALGHDHVRARRLALAAVAITVAVGQLGLWGWRAEQWESRRNPDLDQNALWDVTDSPIAAILNVDIADQPVAMDSLDEPRRMICQDRRLRRLD